MPAISIESIYKEKYKQEEYISAVEEIETWKGILPDIEATFGSFISPPMHTVPAWIEKWAKAIECSGITLHAAVKEARKISHKFKTPLSAELIAEREERR